MKAQVNVLGGAVDDGEDRVVTCCLTIFVIEPLKEDRIRWKTYGVIKKRLPAKDKGKSF